MATKITYILEVDDKGKVKVDGLTKGFVKLDTAVKRVNDDLREQASVTSQAGKATGNLVSDAGLAGATLTELGRTISDANFGIRGMANNLSQLSTLFITLVSKRGGGISGVGLALKQLGRQLLGPLGIILAFQSLIAVLERFAMQSDEAAESTENLTESLDEQMMIFDTLTKNIIKYNLGGKALEQSVTALRSEFKDFAKAYDNLSDKSDESVKNLISQFSAHQDLQKEITLTKEALKDSVVGSQEYEKLQNKLLSLILKRTESEKIFGSVSKKRNEDEKEIIENSVAYYENQIKILEESQSAATSPETFEVLQARIEQLNDMLDAIKGIRDEVESVGRPGRREGYRMMPKDFIPEETSIQKRATKVLKDGLDARNKEFEEYFKNQKNLRSSDLKDTEISEEAKMRALANTGRAFSAVGDLLQNLSEENKALMITGIIVEKVGAISQIIANTSIANTKALAAFPLTFGQPFVGINTASAAVSIAATAASAAKAISAINSGQDTDIGGVAGSTSSTSPTFNVVGQTQFSQLAEAISLQTGEPLRAYVVLDDVTSAEELNNKITSNSTIG